MCSVHLVSGQIRRLQCLTRIVIENRKNGCFWTAVDAMFDVVTLAKIQVFSDLRLFFQVSKV